MKKRLMIVATMMLMIALVACGKEKTEKYEMETDSGKVTVEVKEDGDISITEEIDKAPEFVYEEGTIPLGTYVREDGKVKITFSENAYMENYFEWSRYYGQYEYDPETKIYTIKTTAPNTIFTAYIDEEDNYNLVITNSYRAVKEGKVKDNDHYEDFLDIENGLYMEGASHIDIHDIYIRQ